MKNGGWNKDDGPTKDARTPATFKLCEPARGAVRTGSETSFQTTVRLGCPSMPGNQKISMSTFIEASPSDPVQHVPTNKAFPHKKPQTSVNASTKQSHVAHRG
jgi:hypothetical protein